MNIPSELQNHWLWKDKPFAKGQAWIDLLFLADSESIFFRGRIFCLPKGQLITSENELSKRWKWSRNRVRNFLQLLSNVSMLKIAPSSNNTIITITQSLNQTAIQQCEEQQIIQEKEQAITQPNSSENVDNTSNKKQVKEQVKKQNSNKSKSNSKTTTVAKFRQLTIMDAIESNANEK